MSFSYIRPDYIVQAVADKGFIHPTAIQRQAIPILTKPNADGKYVSFIGQAQSGSGKTAAFGISSILRIDVDVKSPQVIIVANTRELAIQIINELFELTKYTEIEIVAALAGERCMCFFLFG